MGRWWRRIKTLFGMGRSGSAEGRVDKNRFRHQMAGLPARPADKPRLTPDPSPAHEPRRLIEALDHPNPDVRAGAARQLAGFANGMFGRGKSVRDGGAETVVSALIRALSDRDAGVRSSAALSLGEWGAAAAGAVPALIEALAEEDDDVRSPAGIALQDIGRASRQPLEKALAHPDARLRTEAAAILALMPEGEQQAR